MPLSEFLSWDEDDQDVVIGFLHERAQVCSGCGTRRDEWKADEFAYVAESSQCTGCELIERERAHVPPEVRGAKTYLVPREVAEAQIQMELEQARRKP